MCATKVNPASKSTRAFTLVELLVVVLILSILMAVAMPLYLSAVSNAQRQTCRANMQTVANAVQAARIKSGASDYSAIITGGINTTNLPDLSAVPVCPSGGTYSILNGSSGTASTFKAKCTFGTGASAHGTFEPGVDYN